MLWISIGGNFSRLNGTVVYEAKQVSVSACAASNVTNTAAIDNSLRETLSWWPHLTVYELSYMWYAATACAIVIIVGEFAFCVLQSSVIQLTNITQV
jgi:hypothetical protein